MSEESPIEGSIGNLFALAKHWQILADNPVNVPIRETLLQCAKQLQQRAGWVRESVAKQEQQTRYADYVAVMESLVDAGWISNFTMIEGEIKWRPKPDAQRKAQWLLSVLQALPRPKPDARIRTLEEVCGWLAQPAPNIPPAAPHA